MPPTLRIGFECRFVFANKAMAIGMGASEPADLIGKTDFGF